MFDVVLPTVLFLVTAAMLYVHSKYEMRGESIFEEKKLDYRYAVIMVVATGIMASVLLLIPDKAVMIFLCPLTPYFCFCSRIWLHQNGTWHFYLQLYS